MQRASSVGDSSTAQKSQLPARRVGDSAHWRLGSGGADKHGPPVTGSPSLGGSVSGASL